MSKSVRISDLCREFGLTYKGFDIEIDGINLVGKCSSKKSVLVYATSEKYKRSIEGNEIIRALLISPELEGIYSELLERRKGSIIISRDPEKSFYKIHDYLIRNGFYGPHFSKSFVSPTAEIHPTAIIEDDVLIGENVRIGAFSIVKAGSQIMNNASIGNYTCIGADGFQALEFDGIAQKIKHCGGVLIEENVTVGDHCSVCNTLFDGYTRIGANSQIDNYCHIAHYVNIGKNVIITPGVVIVGSAVVENGCYIGAGATIMNKAVIHKGAKVGIGSVVFNSVKEGCTVFGNPAKAVF